MKRFQLAFATFAAAWVSAPITQLQANETSDPQTPEEAVAVVRSERTIAHSEQAIPIIGRSGPVERSGGGFSAPILQFSASSGDAAATFAIQLDLSDGKPRAGPTSGRDRRGYSTLATLKAGLKVEAPLGDGQTDAPFFSLGNLTNGTKATLSISRFSTRVGDGVGAFQIVRDAYRACILKESENWLKTEAGKDKNKEATAYLNEYDAEISRRLNIDATAPITGRGVIEKLGKEEEGKNPVPPADFVYVKCATSENVPNTQTLISRYLSTDAATSFDQTYFTKSPIVFWGLEATASRSSFNSLDTTAFKVNSLGRTGIEAAAFYGRIAASGDESIRARISYSRSYAAPEELQLCRPKNGGPEQECISGPNGLPTRSSMTLFSLEGRKQFALGVGTKEQAFAVAPQLTVDVKTGDFAVDVPLYLAADKDGKLTGGIRVGYRSDKKDYGAGIFVGIPFSTWF